MFLRGDCKQVRKGRLGSTFMHRTVGHESAERGEIFGNVLVGGLDRRSFAHEPKVSFDQCGVERIRVRT